MAQPLRERHRAYWEKLVECQISLATDQAVLGNPDAVKLKICQQIYFPLVTEKYRYYFAPFVAPELRKLDLCIEFNGALLPMHYPIQVLIELLAINQSNPWLVTLRFEKFRSDQAMTSSKARAVRTYFQDRVKKADELKFTGKLYRTFSPQDQTDMWMGFYTCNFKKFWKSTVKLVSCPVGKIFTYFPFRIYQVNSPCIEGKFRMASELGVPRLLSDVLAQFIPHIYPSQMSQWFISIQGLQFPPEARIQVLASAFCYPDNFVHICILRRTYV